MADNALVINTGTTLTMASDDISSVHYPRVKISVGANGVAADWAGTIGTVARLEGGTLTALGAGTITNGTVSTIGLRHPDEFATLVSTGTSTLGTIKAAVSGSSIYVTSIVVSVGSASNVVIGNGGTSLPLLGTLFFNSNGGIALTPIDPPLRTTAGSALVYQQSAAVSPMTIMVTGYVD